MSQSFRGGISNAVISIVESFTAGLFAGTSQPYPNQRVQSTFQPGTAADQVDGFGIALLSLASSTPQSLNLMTGLTDAYGNTLTVARIRFLAIVVRSTTDGANLLVGNAVTNEFDGFLTSGGKLTVFPSSPGNDGYFVISAPNTTGMPVSSSNCMLKLDPGTAAMQVMVVVGTASA